MSARSRDAHSYETPKSTPSSCLMPVITTGQQRHRADLAAPQGEPVCYATVATFLRPLGRIVTARSTSTRRIV
jgi:hypothetical protein